MTKWKLENLNKEELVRIPLDVEESLLQVEEGSNEMSGTEW